MTKTFTENDLVRFLYGELTNDETKDLEQALITDNDLQSRLNELQSVIRDLDRLKTSPSKSVIDKILDYSKGYQRESV